MLAALVVRSVPREAIAARLGAAAALVSLVVKIVFEVVTGSTLCLVDHPTGVVVVPLAHGVGGAVGVAFGLLPKAACYAALRVSAAFRAAALRTAGPFVAAAFRAAAFRAAAPRRRAAWRVCLARAACDTDPRPSRFSAREAARERDPDGLRLVREAREA